VVIFPHGLSYHGPVPPIGLAYLAAVLRDAGHTVQVVDSAGEGIERHVDLPSPIGVLRRIGLASAAVVERLDPATQVVGITHMFLHEWPVVKELAEAVRARFPDVLLLVGGENATAFWPWMFEQTTAIDACVLGEGELTALEVADRVARGEPIGGLPGLVRRDREPAAEEPTLPIRTRRLGEIPWPAWDLFPIEAYWRAGDAYGVERGRSLPMLATRGCPYKCSFCSSPQMWTTRYVVRDPEDVADEIASYVERYGLENVNFSDLTAITKRGWTLRFCDALDQRVPRPISWQLPVGTRAEALDAEVLQRLWDTGCRNITYAPESGSQRMLEIYDKRIDLEHVLGSLASAHEIGLVTRVNIIIGHPEERWSDVWQTFKLLLRVARAGGNDAAVMMYGYYPGSADFTKAVQAGEVVVDDAFVYESLSRVSSHHVSYNPRISARQMRALQMGMLLTFYGLGLVLHPSRLVGYVKAQLTGRESSAVDQLLRTHRRLFRGDAVRRLAARRTPTPPAPVVDPAERAA